MLREKPAILMQEAPVLKPGFLVFIVIKNNRMGLRPNSLARLCPCKHGRNIDALRLAKRLSHARASTVAA